MTFGVKVTTIDGAPLSYTDAFWRYLPSGLVGVAMLVMSLILMSDESVVNLGNLKQVSGPGNWLNEGWIAAQLLTVALNQRRRAIHDYCASIQVVVIGERES